MRHCRAAGHGGKVINISSVHEELAFPNFAAMRQQGRPADAGAHAGHRIGAARHHHQQHRARRNRDAHQREAAQRPVKLDALTRQIPLGRLGKPSRRAALAVFLASSDSDYVTGSTISSTAD